MKDNNDHIIKRATQSLDSWIHQLMTVREQHIYKIQYRAPKTHWYNLEDNHLWDFYGNEYHIVKPRKYIIKIDKACVPEILSTNASTNDTFGLQSDGSTYILMEELDYQTDKR